MADLATFHIRHPLSAIQHFLSSYIARKPHQLEPANHVPADIDLPPMTAEARRSRTSVMIAVPVLAPRCDLQRAEPPDVLAGIDAFRRSGFQVQKTIDEALQVQAIRHAYRADPEESRPAEKEVTET